MKLKNQSRLIELAKEAIIELFSDTSVGKETTIESLEEVRDDIDFKIQCLKEELKGK